MFANLNQLIDQILASQPKSQPQTQQQWRTTPASHQPRVNLYEEEHQVTLTTELPGFKKADLKLEVKGNRFRFSATPVVEPKEASQYYHRERALAPFDRELLFDFRIDPDKVNASFENGILTVVLPALAEDRPRTVALS